MVYRGKLEEPYNRFPPEGAIPLLSSAIIISRLDTKFKNRLQEIYQSLYQRKQNESEIKKVKQDTPHQEMQTSNIMKVTVKDMENINKAINELQSEIVEKDLIIVAQKEETIKLNKRVNDLEKILSTFIVSIIYNIIYIGIRTTTIVIIIELCLFIYRYICI